MTSKRDIYDAETETIVVGWDPAADTTSTPATIMVVVDGERLAVAGSSRSEAIRRATESTERLSASFRIVGDDILRRLCQSMITGYLVPIMTEYLGDPPEPYDMKDFTDDGWGGEKWRRQDQERRENISTKRRGVPVSTEVRGQKSWPTRPRRTGRGR